MSKSQLIKVANFGSVLQAESVRSALEGMGIPAFVEGGHANSIMPHLNVALGGVRLMVRAEDAAKATDALESIYMADDQAPAPDWYCGTCEEAIEGVFFQCWSCGKDKEEVEAPIPEDKSKK